ncbi:O-antigen ligase family protein [Spirulina sp. CS-785/01]|uniref:O-antigen ligase family protein n=1 Tax=Spirulina sp. CS-785/01 TaxID=3021716 RepID=UPI00232C0D47|nr:O-antigen ligase family protein [Spirulina sp. CS-785/01]MDB9312985.1 O-antigen ligase family protein [Spirulina sp. CS-785/01]
MLKNKIQQQVLDRYNFLGVGNTLLAIAPYLCLASYICFIVGDIFKANFKKLTRQQIILASYFIFLSIILLARTKSPWGWGLHSIDHPFLYPVTVIDYIVFLLCLYILMLKPFSKKGIKKIALSLSLSTFPLFGLAIMERFLLKAQGFSFLFPHEQLPIIKFYIIGGSPSRTQAGLGNSNMLGYYCVILIILSLGLILFELFEQWKKDYVTISKFTILQITILTSSIILDLVMIKWSGSKNAVICLVIILGIFGLLIGSKLFLFLTTLLIALISDAILNLSPMGTFFNDLIFSSRPLQNNISPRIWMFGCAIDLIKEKPLKGWGIGIMAVECEERFRFMNHAHNIFLQLASDLGIPFTILFCGVIIYIMFQAFRNLQVNYRNDNSKYLLLGFFLAFCAMMLMSLLSLVIIHSYRLIIISCFCLAIPYAGLEEKSQESSPIEETSLS